MKGSTALGNSKSSNGNNQTWKTSGGDIGLPLATNGSTMKRVESNVSLLTDISAENAEESDDEVVADHDNDNDNDNEQLHFAIDDDSANHDSNSSSPSAAGGAGAPDDRSTSSMTTTTSSKLAAKYNSLTYKEVFFLATQVIICLDVLSKQHPLC